MVVMAAVTFDDGQDFVDPFGVYWVVLLQVDDLVCCSERMLWYIFVE